MMMMMMMATIVCRKKSKNAYVNVCEIENMEQFGLYVLRGKFIFIVR